MLFGIEMKYESIDNPSLIQNGLQHIKYETNNAQLSYFRIARESHSILYRSMIEALRGSANIPITSRPSATRQHKYKIGNAPWKEIHKQDVQTCNKAWRFSLPVNCEPPENDIQRIDETCINQDYLISFYDALAIIQSDCFMSDLGGAPVPVSDSQMKNLEWFHEQIRNEYEHFIPRSYSAPIKDLLDSSIFALNLAKQVIFESGNVYPITNAKVLRSEFLSVTKTLTKIRAG